MIILFIHKNRKLHQTPIYLRVSAFLILIQLESCFYSNLFLLHKVREKKQQLSINHLWVEWISSKFVGVKKEAS